MRQAVDFIRELVDRRYMIYELTKRDFKAVYTGSLLGLTWSFLQPVAMTAIFWVIFSKGFKIRPSGDAPFLLWFLCGLVPWYFFSNCLATNSSVLREYDYLVKSADFRLSILPIVKILSALIVHVIFLGIVLVLLFAYRIDVSLYWLQTVYYTMGLMFLLLGLSWITASLNVFIKDVVQIIGILLQIGFWATPIFWNLKMFPKEYEVFFALNPMFYIVQGYRDSLINQVPFWEKPWLTFYFWGLSFVIAWIGIMIYRRLRPYFADVL
jgi:ABC-type polysaccharide/polyol phosphate export permease